MYSNNKWHKNQSSKTEAHFTRLCHSSDLQLKARHQPYKLCRQWHDLLYRFTEASDEDISQGKSLACWCVCVCVSMQYKVVSFCQVSIIIMFFFLGCLNKKPSLFNQAKEADLTNQYAAVFTVCWQILSTWENLNTMNTGYIKIKLCSLKQSQPYNVINEIVLFLTF